MKVESSTKTIVGILFVVAIAVAFWLLLLAPKRKESDELGEKLTGIESTLSSTRSQLAQAESAKREFPKNYRQLVDLGKAVPEGDETASLIVQLSGVSKKAKVRFATFELGTETGSETSEEQASAPSEGAIVPPTEAEAALLPLGASIGTAGLAAMPYSLSFSGNFSQVANFIGGIDSLVESKGAKLSVNGRLMTINGFALSENTEKGFPYLNANFSIETYIVPPGQGITAGATPTGPSEELTEGTPTASETTK